MKNRLQKLRTGVASLSIYQNVRHAFCRDASFSENAARVLRNNEMQHKSVSAIHFFLKLLGVKENVDETEEGYQIAKNCYEHLSKYGGIILLNQEMQQTR